MAAEGTNSFAEALRIVRERTQAAREAAAAPATRGNIAGSSTDPQNAPLPRVIVNLIPRADRVEYQAQRGARKTEQVLEELKDLIGESAVMWFLGLPGETSGHLCAWLLKGELFSLAKVRQKPEGTLYTERMAAFNSPTRKQVGDLITNYFKLEQAAKQREAKVDQVPEAPSSTRGRTPGRLSARSPSNNRKGRSISKNRKGRSISRNRRR